MSFSEPIISNTSRECITCNRKVKRTRSESWNVGKCPTCWDRDDLSKKIPEVDNSNPLLIIIKPALYNPFTCYLDRYTFSEMGNI